MKIIIVGNGVAGQTAAEKLRKYDKSYEISILTDEKYPYYSRIFLPQYLAGEKKIESMILRDMQWYEENNIKLYLNTEVSSINRVAKLIRTKTDLTLGYDKLILATGSNARKFDFDNPDLDCIFTLRRIKDADEINTYIQENNVNDVFIVGGGLLGIELAHHLVGAGYKTTICEIAPYLLPRQLDRGSADLLKNYLEKQKINVICGSSIDCIEKDEKKTVVFLANDQKFETELILEQIGIIPQTNIAKNSGLKTDKGIIVNEFLQTSDENIYAIGDCIQFKEKIWGIIPASREQALLAVDHIAVKDVKPYEGTVWFTNLKIAGISVKSYGEPPKEENEEEKVYSFVDKEKNICRKAAIREDKLIGAVLLGSSNDSFFRKNINSPVNEYDVEKNIKL